MKATYLLLLFSTLLAAPSRAEMVIHHAMKIQGNPSAHRIEVEDTISLPSQVDKRIRTLTFSLHAGLSPISTTSGAVIRPLSSSVKDGVTVTLYELTLPGDGKTFAINYAGEIYHPVADSDYTYDRGMNDSPGLIGDEGIYLTNSSVWFPRFFPNGPVREMVTFSVDISLPIGWEAVSQGARSQHDQAHGLTHVRWDETSPQSDFYLVGGPLTVYENGDSPVPLFAYLRTPDAALAQKYLEASGRYLRMYSGLLGDYPYQKFALVENFWETGYGMPSFTLLGPTILRFPFIIDSSYPHEILHDWWGNSVFVDYATGNWCEGMTSYLADHMMKEQQGLGADYRRSLLQKYTDYVTDKNDFPLTAFLQRSDSATEAIGYGKSLMLFHMLRLELGDRMFIRALRKFYVDQKFHRASYDNIRAAFESVTKIDLHGQFSQWVTRTGAPKIHVSRATTQLLQNGTYELSFAIEQTQIGSVYSLRIPVAVSLQGQKGAYQTKVLMNSREQVFHLSVKGRPYQLDVDPEFDVFRRLDRDEIPSSISQALGSPTMLFVIPSKATQAVRDAYTAMAKSLGATAAIDIRLDTEVSSLPADRAVWIFGADNTLQSALSSSLKDLELSIANGSVQLRGVQYVLQNHSFVFTMSSPANPLQTVGWIIAEPPTIAGSGLARKIPHYGKYSYLVFEGKEPSNLVKDMWPTSHSPLSIPIVQADGSIITSPNKGTLKPRQPLAETPTAFSRDRLSETVNFLTQPRLKGRELGTPELDEVADYIASKFREAGLQPGGDASGSYFQTWSAELGPVKGKKTLTNVIGILPGRNPALAGQLVVVSAHYDHLGLGWPDVHHGDEGKIHFGADDNASGVAILLELARAGLRPERSIAFIAFTGEEAKFLGSRHFLKNRGSAKIYADVNFDCVGRLGNKKLQIFAAGSAREWTPIFNLSSAATKVPIELIAADLGASDQASFLAAGIPAVHLFSGANQDYHRPTDTADKIDYPGMMKIASVSKEVIDHLISRKAPLTSTLKPAPPEAPDVPGPNPSPEPVRKVYLGTVPDFGFPGPGLRIASVVGGSPAEKAGLRQGDIIVAIDTVPILDLRGYSNFLKTLHAGDQITIHFKRGPSDLSAAVTVIER